MENSSFAALNKVIDQFSDEENNLVDSSRFPYIFTKAWLYLELGPEKYREDDAFNQPPADFDEEDLENTLDMIISGAKRFVKNLGFIKTSTDKIVMNIDYRTNDDDDSSIVRFTQIKNGKLKIGLQGGEPSEIRDIPKGTLSKRVDIKNSKWSFKIEKSEFQDIKKLSSINSDGKVIHLNIENKKVVLSELSTWEFQVDEVDVTDRH